jgi:hypothetical protein
VEQLSPAAAVGDRRPATPPLLVATRSSTVVSDPVAGTTNPKRIPGAVVQHTLAAENQSSGYLDPDVAVLREAVPSGTALYVGDLGTTGSGPSPSPQGSPSSGLTFTYSGLASTTDDVAFSNDGGATYGYIPTPNASGYDSLVTHVSLSPKGTWAGDTGTGFPQVHLHHASMCSSGPPRLSAPADARDRRSQWGRQ